MHGTITVIGALNYDIRSHDIRNRYKDYLSCVSNIKIIFNNDFNFQLIPIKRPSKFQINF